MGFFNDAGQWLKNTGEGLWNGAKQLGADIAGTAHQVATMTLDAGQAVLDGTYTAITNPSKFIDDVGHNIGEGLQHVSDSWSKGADTIASGWSEMKNGRSLWNALGKTVDGVGQIASMGISDAIDDHLEETMVEQRDELGNVIGYTAKEGTDYITRRHIENTSDRRALVTNSEEEIAEAIADGDRSRVSELDKRLFEATTGKDLKQAAMVVGTTALVVGGIVAAPISGGTSLAASGATIAGISAATIGSTAATVGAAAAATGVAANALANSDIDLEELNVADDIADAISEQVEALKASGRLSDDQVDKYTDVMSTYYRATLYSSADPNFAVNNGFESNEQMRDWLLMNNGLPTMNEAASMSGEELTDAYTNYYTDMSEAAKLTQEGAAMMGKVASAYVGGQLTDDQYTTAVCRLQCEALDMTADQKDAYAAYSSKLCLGRITEEQFYDKVANDPLTSHLINDKGEIELKLADYGGDLLQAMSEAEHEAFSGCQSVEPAVMDMSGMSAPEGYEPEYA